MKKPTEIDLLLSRLDKKQVCEFIKKECANDMHFRERFLALGSGTELNVNSAHYTYLVKDLIDKYSGRYGYVEYRNTYNLNREVCSIIDEADTAIHDRQWDVAVAVLSGISEVGEDVMDCGDDSGGELGGILGYCFELWGKLCENEDLPKEVKEKVFNLFVSYFEKENLKGWDWWWYWIEMAVILADTSEKQDRLIKILDDIIDMGSDGLDTDYDGRRAQTCKLEIMSKVDSEEERIKFMYDNIGNPDFRKRLLQKSWDEGNYDEVLRLAKDGVEHDLGCAGLVNDWRKWEFKVYRHNDDRINLLQVAEYFFKVGGSWGDSEFYMDSMYALIKSIVDSKEWNGYVDGLLARLSDKRYLTHVLYIYTEEKMWDKYMEYLCKNPSTRIIDDAPKEVLEQYKDEIKQIYSSEVRKYFVSASNRDSYRNGVDLLRNLIKYGGKTEADEIVQEQKNRRPRRTALIDELSKL